MLSEEKANEAIRIKRRAKQLAAKKAVSSVKRGYSTFEAAEYIGISEAVLRRYRNKASAEIGPRHLKIGTRVIYLKDDLDEWINRFSAA